MKHVWLELLFFVLFLVSHRVEGQANIEVIRVLQKMAKEPQKDGIANLMSGELSKLKDAAFKYQIEEHKQETHFYIPSEFEKGEVFEKFIDYKLKSGTKAEQQYYKQFKEDVKAFIASLIKKRARIFFGPKDWTVLKEEQGNFIVPLPWHKIGKDEWEDNKDMNATGRVEAFGKWISESFPNLSAGFPGKFGVADYLEQSKQQVAAFTIHNYLSYDEMQLAALMIAAGPTTFYSNCFLKYDASFGKRLYGENEFVKNGYIVGAVGPRMEKPGVMDFALMLDPTLAELRQVIYGAEFKTLPLPSNSNSSEFITLPWWDNVWWDWVRPQNGWQNEPWWQYARQTTEEQTLNKKTGKPIEIQIPRKLHNKRLQISYGAYLDFAHQTMKKLQKENNETKAYIMMLAIGGGAWSINPAQPKYSWPAIRELLEQRSEYSATIGTLHFVAFPETYIDANGQEQAFPAGQTVNGITITNAAISGPTGRIKGDENTVRFTVYPWDGNALPGNEWWIPTTGNWEKFKANTKNPAALSDWLEKSGDPAAACCSDIIYTQNWLVNTDLARPGDAKYLARNNIDAQYPRYDPHSDSEGWADIYEDRSARRRLSGKDEEETPAPLVSSVSASYRSVSHWALVVSTAVLAISTVIISFYMVFIR
eukprot:CAMPEP_0197030192 /NCGR_PEP_ID=MMETSP1384-20130603/9471_1 /TAXON_ID=29189 /ORGANISM="Ammonia sp." /LENGTH=648 /DNA_ID=CAMNT_0042459487 /DNA_START=190 /DNA_END=2136 /DNA_ORIENTATION=-